MNLIGHWHPGWGVDPESRVSLIVLEKSCKISWTEPAKATWSTSNHDVWRLWRRIPMILSVWLHFWCFFFLLETLCTFQKTSTLILKLSENNLIFSMLSNSWDTFLIFFANKNSKLKFRYVLLIPGVSVSVFFFPFWNPSAVSDFGCFLRQPSGATTSSWKDLGPKEGWRATRCGLPPDWAMKKRDQLGVRGA